MKTHIYLLAMFLIFAILTPSLAMDVTPGHYKVSVQSSLTVRDAPNVGSKIGSLYNDNSIEVLECNQGWAKIVYGSSIGYVKADYLKSSENININEENHNLKIISFDSINDIKYLMPFVIIVLLLLMWLSMSIDSQVLFQISCFLLGLSELVLFIPINGGSGSSIPPFCEPNEVGWLFAIINFILMVGILLFQYSIYKVFTEKMDFGFWQNIFFMIFIFVGLLSFCAIFTVTIYSIALFAIFFIILLYILRSEGFLITSVFMIHSFGLLLSFLNALSVLIIGGIIWFIISELGKEKSAPKKRYRIRGTDTVLEHDYGDNYKDIRTNEHWRRSGNYEFEKIDRER